MFLGRADACPESVLGFLCNHPIEQKGSDATKEEAKTKDETDVGEVEGENVSDCDESKNAVDGNVAVH